MQNIDFALSLHFGYIMLFNQMGDNLEGNLQVSQHITRGKNKVYI
jgi:hypothetical protein